MSILNEEVVKRAVELSRPSVLAILEQEDMVWGPKWVTGFVVGPGIKDSISFQLGEDPEKKWDRVWGLPLRFVSVAKKKLEVVLREKEPTSVVVATRPWCLEEREYLYPGGAYRDGIAVTTSGAKGRADEAIAEIILANIRMLAFLETDKRIEKGEMQI